MKLSQKSQKPSAHQTQLDQYLTLKPHRAVQRLLQQNDLQQCFDIYNLLQQNVKANTTQLRSVLYNKHESLHQCSQMIHRIQDFALKVKNIQNDIDSLLKTEIADEPLNLHKERNENPIARIEELMDEKEFSLALTQCNEVLGNSVSAGTSDSHNCFYISFLKVEIIQKLQAELQNTSLTTELINESVQTLRQFMMISPVEQILQFIQKSSPSLSQPILNIGIQQTENISILQLLYQKCQQVEDIEHNYPLADDYVIEVIFKFKLLTLKQSSRKDHYSLTEQNSEYKVNFLYNKVFNYFSDLLKIIEEVSIKEEHSDKDNKSNSLSKLYQIFNSNIQKTIAHISQLFIVDKRKESTDQIRNEKNIGNKHQNSPTLSFQNELYEKLLQSDEFLQVLNSLERHFNSATTSLGQQNQNNQILSIIKNLWRDFYHQMLDIISQKINPSSLFRVQLSPPQQIPQQFIRFSTLPFQKITKQKLNNYQKELNIFFSNFKELLSKSKSSDQKKSIISYFLELKTQIGLQCREEIKKLGQKLQLSLNDRKLKNLKLHQRQVKEMMILFFLSQSYNIAWKTQFQNENSQFRKLIDTDSRTYQCQTFQIRIFKTVGENESEVTNFYQILNTYLELQFSYHHLSASQYIQRWQQELDTLFGSYHAVVKENELLKSELKHLILALIKTKLQTIAHN